jgi:hypothetical protein
LSSTTFKGNSINLSGYTTVVFPEPVAVSGNFYVEIKGMATINTEVAIASSRESTPTVYVYKSQVWSPLEDYDPEKRKISMNIVPTFTYDVESGIQLLTENENRVDLFPNPVVDYFTIRSQSPVEKVTIMDIQGRRIQEVNAWGTEQKIQTSNWRKGIYIVRIQTEKDICNYKVIKE